MLTERMTHDKLFKDEMFHLICIHFVNTKYKKQHLTLRNRLNNFIHDPCLTFKKPDELDDKYTFA